MEKIHTGNFKNCTIGNTISIENSKNHNGLVLPTLMIDKKLPSNIDELKEMEELLYYIREYYDKVLKKLDPRDLLESLPNDPIIVSSEDPSKPSNRHLVAFWFELFLGIQTSEIRVNPKRETLTRLDRPEYLKKMLESVVKTSYDMNGYDSIQGAYLFNKAQEAEKSYKLENN